MPSSHVVARGRGAGLTKGPRTRRTNVLCDLASGASARADGPSPWSRRAAIGVRRGCVEPHRSRERRDSGPVRNDLDQRRIAFTSLSSSNASAPRSVLFEAGDLKTRVVLMQIAPTVGWRLARRTGTAVAGHQQVEIGLSPLDQARAAFPPARFRVWSSFNLEAPYDNFFFPK